MEGRQHYFLAVLARPLKRGTRAMGFTEDMDTLASLEESEPDNVNLLEHEQLQVNEEGHRNKHGKADDTKLLQTVAFAVIGPLMFGFTLGCA